MSTAEIAAAWAEKMARDDAHGYDQTGRWGPDYDCSSLVITAYKQAGVGLVCTYTGNMKADMLSRGFRDVTKKVNLKTGQGLERGDVLLHERSHTAMALGNGKLVHAAGNEYGRATGGRTGDQTGKEICVTGYFNFPWEWVLRYEGKARADEGIGPYTETEGKRYTVKQGDSLWGIAERELGNGFLYEEIRKLNGLPDYWIWPGQVLKLPGKDPSAAPQDDREKVTLALKKTVLQKMKKAAEAGGLTLAELIERKFQ